MAICVISPYRHLRITVPHERSASATATFTTGATGLKVEIVQGSGSSTTTSTATATGLKIAGGVATCTVTCTTGSTGSITRTGSADCVATFVTQSSGLRVRLGTATCTVTCTTASTGSAILTGSADCVATFTTSSANSLTFTNANSVYFNRYSSYVGACATVGSQLNSTFSGATNATMSAWVNANKLPGAEAFGHKVCYIGCFGKNITGSPLNMQLYLDGTDYEFWGSVWNHPYSISPKASTAPVSLNQWYHLVMTFDGAGGEAKLYINGSLANTTTNSYISALPTISGYNFDIGRNLNSSPYGYMEGHIDEFAIWDATLTATEVSQIYHNGVPDIHLAYNFGNYTSASDLQGYWRMGTDDSGIGTTISDKSGNSRDATLTSQGGGTDGYTHSSLVPPTKTATAISCEVACTTTATGEAPILGSATCTIACTVEATGEVPAFANEKSLDFDGSDEHMTTTFDPTTIGTGEFTVSAWVKWDSFSGNPMQWFIGGHNTTDNPDNFIALQVLTSGTVLRVQGRKDNSGTTIFNTTASLSTGTWYHIVLTRQGTGSGATVKVYVDGGSAEESSAHEDWGNDLTRHTSGNTEDFRIAKYFNSNFYHNGHIDEVAIWNVALDADAVTAIYNSGTPITLTSDSGNYDVSGNLKAWWRMGDGTEAGSGSTVYDMSTQSNNGTLQNMEEADYTTDVPLAMSIKLDGTDEYLYMSDANASSGGIEFDYDEEWSIGFWVKKDNLNNTGYWTKKTTGGTTGIMIDAISGKLRFIITGSNGVGAIIGTDAAHSTDTWLHYVCTKGTGASVSDMTIYLNGSVAATSTLYGVSGPVTASTGNSDPIRIGGLYQATPTNLLNGKLWQVTAFDKELSSTEVSTLYNSGAGKTYSAASGDSYYSDTKLWLDFDDKDDLGNDASGTQVDFSLQNMDSTNHSQDVPS